MMKKLGVLLTAILLPIMFCEISRAAHFDLAWDANAESDLAGYRLYYGTASGEYGDPIDVGNVTGYRLNDVMEDVQYFLALTAYDTSNNESDFSEEVDGIVESSTPPENGNGGCFIHMSSKGGCHGQNIHRKKDRRGHD